MCILIISQDSQVAAKPKFYKPSTQKYGKESGKSGSKDSETDATRNGSYLKMPVANSMWKFPMDNQFSPLYNSILNIVLYDSGVSYGIKIQW